MTRAAQALRDDQKARRVLTETKAVVHLVPVAGTDPEAWANELRQRLPEATKVDVLDPVGLAAKMKTTLPPCPPEGER